MWCLLFTRPERYDELHVKRIFVNAALGKSMARVEVVSNQPSVATALRTVNETENKLCVSPFSESHEILVDRYSVW